MRYHVIPINDLREHVPSPSCWCKQVGAKVLSFEAGWLLDVYVKSPANAAKAPLATFQFQPQIKTAKA